jgi:hypothetical protein
MERKIARFDATPEQPSLGCKDTPITVDTRKSTTKTFTKLLLRECRNTFSTTDCSRERRDKTQAFENGSAHDPAHAGDFAVGVTNTRDRLRERLDRNRHVKGVGVKKGRGVTHDRHVAFPEDEVATPQ